MPSAADAARPITAYLAEAREDVAGQVRGWAETSGGFLQLHCFAHARELSRRLAYERPDLLLLDATLPRFDGLTAVRALRGRGIPVVLLSPDTVEGARLTLQALLDGADDFLMKRCDGGRVRLVIGRDRFLGGIRRLLGTSWAAEVAPCLGERAIRRCRLLGAEADGLRCDGAEGWLRLDPRGTHLSLRGSEDPWSGGQSRHLTALATSRSLARLATHLAAAPVRSTGGATVFVPLSRPFARALREVLSRRWNRTVLELQPEERLRPGQWRLTPGRALLQPEGEGVRLVPNRWVDESRATAHQLELLREAPPGTLRVLLVERPGGATLAPILALVREGHGVYLHADALAGPEPAGAGTWLAGQGEWAADVADLEAAA